MGNTKAKQATDATSRLRFKQRLADALHVPLGDVAESVGQELCLFVVDLKDKPTLDALSARAGFAVPPHRCLVTFGCGHFYGVELVLRVPVDEPQHQRVLEAAHANLGVLHMMMAGGTRFGPYHTVQFINRWPWADEHKEQGLEEALILAERHVLHGLLPFGGRENEQEDEEDKAPFYDDDRWPQRFLLLHPLRPREYLAVSSSASSGVSEIISEDNPLFLSSTSRPHYAKDEPFASRIEELRLKTPVNKSIDGLLMGFEFREEGEAVDVVLGPHWMQSLLQTLEQAFDKPEVPLGTLITAESDSDPCCATFQAHHKDGAVVTSETATFDLHRIFFKVTKEANGEDESFVELTDLTEEQKEGLLERPEELDAKDLFVRIHAEFFMPPKLLAKMHADWQRALEGKSWDFGKKPLCLSWPTLFHGVGRSSNALPAFRLITVGVEYMQADGLGISADGRSYVRA
ncbi:hypothetical protein QOT17_006197 [Balamuthia mandrillaris]